MNPGTTNRSAQSITFGACAPSSGPTATTFVSCTATSALKAGPPVPSITQPFLRIRSTFTKNLASLGKASSGLGLARRILTAPEVPACDGPIRPPRLGERVAVLRTWHLRQTETVAYPHP